MSTVLDPSTAARVVRERYGLDGVASPLPSYVDENHRLDAGDAGRFILRLAHPDEAGEVLAFQHAVLAHLARAGVPAPRLVRDRQGRDLARLDGRFLRLHSWIDGVPLATVVADPTLWRRLGEHLGLLDRALADLDTPAPVRDFVWDLAQSLGLAADLGSVTAGPRRACIQAVLDRFEHVALPVLQALPAQPIHNDANPHNVLVQADGGGGHRVVGLTDFGDTLRAPLVCEPAIAAAYALQPPWLAPPQVTGAALFQGYTSRVPLSDPALAIAPLLIETRVAVSVVCAALGRAQDPDNGYISVHEAPGWALLEWFDTGGREVLGQALSP